MSKEEIFQQLNSHPAFHVATVEGDQPHTRAVLLYRADENGIIFHTARSKDLFSQIEKNPKAEFCFDCDGVQIRISGELTILDDNNLKDEIVNHPTRTFLKAWTTNGELSDFYNSLQVLCMIHGKATTWTMDTNFAPKEYIQL